MSTHYIEVVKEKTGEVVARYSTISLASIDLRVTYPTLCHHLSKRGLLKTRGLIIRRAVPRKRISSRPLQVQIHHIETGTITYAHTIAEASRSTNVGYDLLSYRLSKNQSVAVIDGYRFYKIG